MPTLERMIHIICNLYLYKLFLFLIPGTTQLNTLDLIGTRDVRLLKARRYSIVHGFRDLQLALAVVVISRRRTSLLDKYTPRTPHYVIVVVSLTQTQRTQNSRISAHTHTRTYTHIHTHNQRVGASQNTKLICDLRRSRRQCTRVIRFVYVLCRRLHDALPQLVR